MASISRGPPEADDDALEEPLPRGFRAARLFYSVEHLFFFPANRRRT
jgi:hypothetical protein